MGLIIFVLLLAMPIIEIVIFVQAGGAIGWMMVILLTVFTALLGTFIIRAQGFAALKNIQSDVSGGRVPVRPAVDGLFLMLAAPLLMTPGFLTDAVGFSLLVPAIRHRIAEFALVRVKRAMDDGTVTIVRPR